MTNKISIQLSCSISSVDSGRPIAAIKPHPPWKLPAVKQHTHQTCREAVEIELLTQRHYLELSEFKTCSKYQNCEMWYTVLTPRCCDTYLDDGWVQMITAKLPLIKTSLTHDCLVVVPTHWDRLLRWHHVPETITAQDNVAVFSGVNGHHAGVWLRRNHKLPTVEVIAPQITCGREVSWRLS